MPTGKRASRLDVLVRQFLQSFAVGIIDLERIHSLIVNGHFRVKLNGPTRRFSPDRHYAAELAGYSLLLCRRLRLQVNSKNRQNESHGYSSEHFTPPPLE